MSSYSNIDFDHQIYTLASVHQEYSFRPPYYNKNDKSYLKLLDDIAFLLVKDSGDVVALSMEIHPSKVVFSDGNNGPCDDASVTTYLDQIINVIREREPEDFTRALLPVVLAECSAKFGARIGKCQKALEECGDIFGAAPDSHPRNRFPDELTGTYGQTPPDFSKDVKSFDTGALVTNSHLERLVLISVMAGLLDTVTPKSRCTFIYQKLSYPVVGIFLPQSDCRPLD